VAISLQNIHSAATANRIKWRYHALLRFRERGITREQAKLVMREGEIVEQHPKSSPFPKCLMMAIVEPNRPLYVALAYDQVADYIHVITVHWLDPSKWDDPWTRKKP
jgi:hypothetical protein